eukprot:jgi/Mesen1/1826/ME000142S01000
MDDPKKERMAVQLLSTEEVLASLRSKLHGTSASYRAFYSSAMGGVTRDPALMLVAMDDHLVHRGHAVFDTALLRSGYLYEVEPHLDRLLRSAAQARVALPFPRDEIRQILIELCQLSGVEDGSVRYWLSVGPGSFNLDPLSCTGPTFYAVVIADAADDVVDMTHGVKVITSSMPMKAPLYGTMKSTNYLPNALVMAEAQEPQRATKEDVDDEEKKEEEEL